MAYDLKIVGGTVIDGTGAPGVLADVAVRGGVIVAVGHCPDEADEVIDAAGAIVTPGFTDLHCHYDGQVSWDADLAPSCFHGVTTMVLGNCGVGFAPVRPSDHQRLIELMEGVEDIPGSALAEGIPWGWESFPEYMNVVDSFAHTVDFALLVPHDALRVYVMGDRAVAKEPATDSDIARMRELTREALLAGAAGFSTGRTDNHRSLAGDPTPASEATTRELCGIAGAFEGIHHGVLQAVSDFDMQTGPERFDPEFDVIEAMARAAHSHSTSISLMQRDIAPDQWKHIIARTEAASAQGVPMRLQVAPRAIGVLLGLQATFHPFMGFPSYKRIAKEPLDRRVALMRDEAFKRQLLTERSEPVAGDGSPIPPLADQLLARIDMVALRLFRLGESPDYEQTVERSIFAEAMTRDISPLEAIYDAMLENDGKELLYFPLYNYTEMSLENVRTMMNHPLSLPGLSDGGAHVGTVCDASFSTYLLTHWGRDRAEGRMSVESIVKRMTLDTSRYLGLTDRGTVAVGQRADLNVIDHTRLGLTRPTMVQDLPGGGRRLIQRAKGYRATLVRGEVVLRDDELTGTRPGRLVRVGREAS